MVIDSNGIIILQLIVTYKQHICALRLRNFVLNYECKGGYLSVCKRKQATVVLQTFEITGGYEREQSCSYTGRRI